MHVSFASRPGSVDRVSEDFVAASQSTVVVLGTRGQVASAALLTDGASSLTDRYHQVDWPELLTLLHRRRPGHLIDRVRMVEDADPHGIRWPRYKRSDDATAAYCELGPLSTVASA
jgi:hypothetical protein